MLEEVLKEYADKFAEAYRTKLLDPAASGKLLNSVRTSVRHGGNTHTIEMNLQDYWLWVEKGRRPGKFPPVDQMIRFVRDKPVLPQPYTLPSGRKVLPTENQLAFLIGRKIARDGIEAKNYLQDAIDGLKSGFVREVKEAVVHDIIEQLNN